MEPKLLHKSDQLDLALEKKKYDEFGYTDFKILHAKQSSCSKISEIDYSEDIKIVKISNLKIINTDAEPIYIPGKTFISSFNYHMHHFLAESIAQYENIKNIIPELKTIFVDDAPYPYWRNSFNDTSGLAFVNDLKTISFGTRNKDYEPHQYFEPVFNAYSNDGQIYNMNYDNLFFEEVYFIVDFSKIIPKGIFEQHNFIPMWMDKDIDVYAKINYNSFMPKGLFKINKTLEFKENHTLPKKIYISRSDSNERKKKQYVSTATEEKMKHDIEIRVFDNEADIEGYFISLGYHSVSFEKISYIEQLQYMRNATHIAALSGTAIINSFACNKDATIIELRVKSGYNHTYKDYHKFYGISKDNNLVIDLRYLNEDPEKILNELKSMSNIFQKSSGDTAYITRAYNNIFIDEKKNILIKSSTNTEKIKSEHDYYWELPHNIMRYFAMPFDFKYNNSRAEYSMEIFKMQDLAGQYVSGELSVESFKELLERIKSFQDECYESTESEKFNVDVMQESIDIILNKIDLRIQELESYDRWTGSDFNKKLSSMHITPSTLRDRVVIAFGKYSGSRKTFIKKISHGDLCFSNILWDYKNKMLKLIDPKGVEYLYMDEYYDVAKLSHSINGFYDYIINELYEIDYLHQKLIFTAEKNQEILNLFKEYLNEKNIDYKLMRTFEASIFLSMLPNHSEDDQRVAALMLTCHNILKELEN
jgi:hypothetical protein